MLDRALTAPPHTTDVVSELERLLREVINDRAQVQVELTDRGMRRVALVDTSRDGYGPLNDKDAGIKFLFNLQGALKLGLDIGRVTITPRGSFVAVTLTRTGREPTLPA